MTDAKPASAIKPNGGFIVIGVLVVAGVALWLMQGSPESSSVADAGIASDAVTAQTFDIEPDPSFPAGVPLRPMDRDIFAAMKDPSLSRERMQDLFPDRPYKVRLIGSLPEHRFALVIIDLNRDGKREERWDLRGVVTRIVPDDPNAPGSPVKYTLGHGKWQVH